MDDTRNNSDLVECESVIVDSRRHGDATEQGRYNKTASEAIEALQLKGSSQLFRRTTTGGARERAETCKHLQNLWHTFGRRFRVRRFEQLACWCRHDTQGCPPQTRLQSNQYIGYWSSSFRVSATWLRAANHACAFTLVQSGVVHDVMVRTWDSRSTARRLDSRPFYFHVTIDKGKGSRTFVT